MVRNIILLDRCGNLLEYILKNRDDNIVILVFENHEKIAKLISQYQSRISYCVDYDDLLAIQDVKHINYDLIEKMKFAQIDIETMLHRIMLNNPLAKDIYHQHLSFFTGIFQQSSINYLISSEVNLASPNYHILFALCTLLGIPCYSLNSYHYSAVALANYNTKEVQRHIPYIPETKYAQIKEIVFYQPKTTPTGIKKDLKRYIKDITLKVGGEILSQFMVCLSKCSFMQDRLGVPYSYWNKFYYFLKYKRLKRFYEKHSIVPNFNEKYIYYSIHFEPEAAIIGKTMLESQLTIIKMLSKAIPNDWKLYVKEHPHQFMLNNEISHYFINNLDFFKNISFYQEIKKIRNVVLVSLKVSSKDLMQNSQAVATLGGTISLESALYSIPAILFNPLESVYSILSHTLHVRSYEDLLLAIAKIQNNFLKDKKIDLNEIKSYLANPNDKDFYSNLFSTIEQHAKTIKPTGEKL